jgi:hypothetical protein
LCAIQPWIVSHHLTEAFELAVSSRIDLEVFQLLFAFKVAAALFRIHALQVVVGGDDFWSDQNLQVDIKSKIESINRLKTPWEFKRRVNHERSWFANFKRIQETVEGQSKFKSTIFDGALERIVIDE